MQINTFLLWQRTKIYQFVCSFLFDLKLNWLTMFLVFFSFLFSYSFHQNNNDTRENDIWFDESQHVLILGVSIHLHCIPWWNIWVPSWSRSRFLGSLCPNWEIVIEWSNCSQPHLYSPGNTFCLLTNPMLEYKAVCEIAHTSRPSPGIDIHPFTSCIRIRATLRDLASSRPQCFYSFHS